MQVIANWTGGYADALRRAMRLTYEDFAEHLGVSVRQVNNWHARPGIIPQAKVQRILDTALDNADDRTKVQFSALVENSHEMILADSVPQSGAPEKLNADEQDRIRRVIHSPNRLDVTTVLNLTQALVGQRHAEDSLGPDLIIGPMSAQRDVLEAFLRNAYGPHRKNLAHLVANWTTFVGWLHIALGEYSDADVYFAKAEDMSDEIGDGVLASTATCYRGYIALLQGRHRAALRSTMAAIATPGAHPTQVAYGHLQAAQAYAGLDDRGQARSFLQKASNIVTTAGNPPESTYWYTEPFLRMNIGMAQHSIGEYRDAADSIGSGIAELPADQTHAQWLDEYRQALDYSTAVAGGKL